MLRIALKTTGRSGMRFFFNCNNLTQAKALETCGVRNVILNFKYVHFNLIEYNKMFDCVMVHARDNREIYEDWLEENIGLYHFAFQCDEGAPNPTIFRMEKSKGLNVIPILHGNYIDDLSKIKDLLYTGDIVGLGKGKGRLEEDSMVKRLPPTYIYHGMAKGRWVKDRIMNSIDSSTWLSALRGRKTDVHGSQAIFLGDKGLSNQGQIQLACSKNIDYLTSADLNTQLVLQADPKSLLKVPISLYYKPLFKSLDIYDENFKV